MHAPDYFLPLNDPETLKRARRWLLLGVTALGLAGIFAGLLANTKSPYFYTALVVHVDLSVLVWFLTMACMFFTLAGQGRGYGILADAAFWSMAAGALLIVLSAFTGGEPYMSNYIPVIRHPVFFLGLGLLFSGVLCSTINLIACGKVQTAGVPSYGVALAAWIMLIAVACFIRSQQSVPTNLQGEIYYEYAFWGGGHVLQFVHVQLMLVAWLWLAATAGLRPRLNAGRIVALYFIGLLAMIAAALIYGFLPPESDEHRNAFTLLMKHMNGVAPLVLGVFIIDGFIRFYSSFPRRRESLLPAVFQDEREIPAFAGMTMDGNGTKLARITLLMSMLLFAAGGALGYRIAGSNLLVPAHYHGSIVGVTLAYMGVAYLLLPAFGGQGVARSRLALLQPILYGGGQLCWMAGMAILGAHGVPRKTPGSADTVGALAAFLKHGGDGLALIGGLLFVFIVLRAVFQKRKQ